MNIQTELSKYTEFLKGNYKIKIPNKFYLIYSVFSGDVLFRYYLKNYINDSDKKDIDMSMLDNYAPNPTPSFYINQYISTI